MSFEQGLSGLNAASQNLDVIGNNVANANTYGSKSSRVEFADVYAAAVNGSGTNQVGIGVSVDTIAQQFTQGSIITTENPLDVAINGNGFFELRNTDGSTSYSRNGQFKVDKDGYIVNDQSRKLLGYAADSNGVVLPGASVPLQLPTAGVSPKATTAMGLEINLDSRKAVTLPAAPAANIVLTNPLTYNDATSVTAYDAKGQDVAMTYYFQKAATDTWNVYVTANGTSVSVDANNVPQPVTQIVFPANGGAPTSPTAPFTLNIPASTNSAGAATLPITGVQVDVLNARQYGAPFSVTNLTQDGYAPGQLAGLSIEANGVLTARYTNGQTKSAGQLELATFRNPQGLQAIGGNAWSSTFASGTPIAGAPGQGNIGVLQSGALEESNVDLTGELVNMITAQRTYQANAQTIKTQDSVMQTIVNLR